MGSVCAETDSEISADECCSNSFMILYTFSSVDTPRWINSDGTSGGGQTFVMRFVANGN